MAEECTMDKLRPGAKAIQEAIATGLIEVYPIPSQIFMEPILLNLLDRGETEAIKLSLHLNIPILIDEKLGRQIAKKNRLSIIGTGGLLLSAKKAKPISKVSPLIKKLQENDYYLSKNLASEILRKANEPDI